MPISFSLKESLKLFERPLEMQINDYTAYADFYYPALDAKSTEEAVAAVHYFYQNWIQTIDNQMKSVLLFDLSDEYIGYLYFKKQSNDLHLEYRYTIDICGYSYYNGQYPEYAAQVEKAPFDSIVVFRNVSADEIRVAIADLLARLPRYLGA